VQSTTGKPAAGSQPEGGIDAGRALEEWRSRVPASLREAAGLPEHDMHRLFAGADRVLREPSPQALQQIESLAYQIGRRVLPVLGLDPVLRYLRDEFLRVLEQRLGSTAWRGEAPVALIGARVTDALWRAHTDALQTSIQRQREQSLEQELMLAKRIQQRLLPTDRLQNLKGMGLLPRLKSRASAP
jgi:hypothetical protein